MCNSQNNDFNGFFDDFGRVIIEHGRTMANTMILMIFFKYYSDIIILGVRAMPKTIILEVFLIGNYCTWLHNSQHDDFNHYF